MQTETCEREYLISKDLRAIEADASHDGENGLEEADMEHGLCKLEVPEVARALRHVGHARLALHLPVDGPEPRVAESPGLRLPPLHRLGVLDLHHRHLPLPKQPQITINSQRNRTKLNRNKRLIGEKKVITISSGLRMPNWTVRTLATSAGEKGNRMSMATN